MSAQPTLNDLGDACRTALGRLFDETRKVPGFPAEIREDALTATVVYVGALLDEVRRHSLFADRARKNIEKWGAQDYETLALCIAEESGEVAQAVLQYHHEAGDEERIRAEAIDLGALCVQLVAAFDVAVGEVEL